MMVFKHQYDYVDMIPIGFQWLVEDMVRDSEEYG